MTCPNKIYKNYTSPNEKTKQSQIGSRGFTSNLKVCNNLQPLKEKQHNPACLICHHLQYPAYRGNITRQAKWEHVTHYQEMGSQIVHNTVLYIQKFARESIF